MRLIAGQYRGLVVPPIFKVICQTPNFVLPLGRYGNRIKLNSRSDLSYPPYSNKYIIYKLA